MKIAEREMVMEIGMMMMKMEMATHCAQECQFLIKRMARAKLLHSTNDSLRKNFQCRVGQKYSYFFSYPNL